MYLTDLAGATDPTVEVAGSWRREVIGAETLGPGSRVVHERPPELFRNSQWKRPQPSRQGRANGRRSTVRAGFVETGNAADTTVNDGLKTPLWKGLRHLRATERQLRKAAGQDG